MLLITVFLSMMGFVHQTISNKILNKKGENNQIKVESLLLLIFCIFLIYKLSIALISFEMLIHLFLKSIDILIW